MKSALILSGLLVSSALCVAQTPAALKNEFQKRFEVFAKAFATTKWDEAGKMVGKDFTTTGPQGGKEVTWPEVVADFTRMSTRMKGAKWVRTVQSVTPSGKELFVIVNGDLQAGMPGPDGKVSQIKFLSTSKDTWVKLDGQWKLHRAEVQKTSMTTDGKPPR